MVTQITNFTIGLDDPLVLKKCCLATALDFLKIQTQKD